MKKNRKIVSVSLNETEMQIFNKIKDNFSTNDFYELTDSQLIKIALKFCYQNLEEKGGVKYDK